MAGVVDEEEMHWHLRQGQVPSVQPAYRELFPIVPIDWFEAFFFAQVPID